MNCCKTSSTQQNDHHGAGGESPAGSENSTKTMVAWALVIVVIAGLLTWIF
ncbi:hypothetical protein HZA86_02865 [Candidatus Uhrbacteria bacterium]|nr:hypothetical protein [Candidatus Uhrbacteria bacterium]